MIDFKMKILVFLLFVTGSLLFNMDLESQVDYTFESLDINISELTDKQIDKVISHSTSEIFNQGYHVYPKPETIENKISSDKYRKVTNIVNMEKDYNALVIRGYEVDEYVTVRYFIETKDDNTLEDIVATYKEELINSGYEDKENILVKDDIEVSFLIKWDCITLMIKGF